MLTAIKHLVHRAFTYIVGGTNADARKYITQHINGQYDVQLRIYIACMFYRNRARESGMWWDDNIGVS